MGYMQQTRSKTRGAREQLLSNRRSRGLFSDAVTDSRHIVGREGYLLGNMRGNSAAQNIMPAYGSSPAQRARKHTAPIRKSCGEQNSIFDFRKLKAYLKFQIPQFAKVKNAWQGEALSDEDLNNYTKRVQTLFEDIRQVDLQFLAVTNASYEEGGRDADNSNHPELYKALIEQRLAYMHKIKRELVREKDAPDTSEERRNILLSHLRNVGRQIKFLRQIINQGAQRSYVFHVNTLLQESDAEAYMVIPAPSTDTYKDIYIRDESTDDRQLAMSSKTLQMGIDTPIRAFSWYIKYLLNSDEGVHNPPLIRKLKIPQGILDEEILSRMASESCPGGKRPFVPMNEDFKVENQFNIPKEVFQCILDRLPDAADRLETIGAIQKTPESMMQGGGHIVDLDDFKKQIGFARKKGNEIVATDIHFFDYEHTAFFQISKNAGRIRTELYSTTALKKEYDEVSELMENMILKFGTNCAINSPLVSIWAPSIQSKTFNEKIRILLEANHCMPPGRAYDLKGNNVSAIADEKKFASELLSEKETDAKITALLRLTFKRLEQVLQSDDKTRNAYIKKLQKDSGLLYEYQNVCAGRKDAPAFSMLWENPSAFGFLYKIVANKKMEVTAFALKLLRIIMQEAPEEWGKHSYDEDSELEQRLFAKRMAGDYFDSVNMRSADDVVSGRSRVHIPFDKMTSTGRFVPKRQGPKLSFVPFVGGASDTTTDSSTDVMLPGLLHDEKDYWNFHLLNAAFMIAYSYHSFVEVMLRAATTRRKYYGSESKSEPITSDIMEYLNSVVEERNPVQSKELIQKIRGIIDKQRVNSEDQ